jgi:hypothetical protein
MHLLLQQPEGYPQRGHSFFFVPLTFKAMLASNWIRGNLKCTTPAASVAVRAAVSTEVLAFIGSSM